MQMQWLVVGGIMVLGCASVKPTAQVHMAHEEARGKAIFLISPATSEPECSVPIDTSMGVKRLDCNSQYLMACDADAPADQPFCELVREVGQDRLSAYPQDRRQ